MSAKNPILITSRELLVLAGVVLGFLLAWVLVDAALNFVMDPLLAVVGHSVGISDLPSRALHPDSIQGVYCLAACKLVFACLLVSLFLAPLVLLIEHLVSSSPVIALLVHPLFAFSSTVVPFPPEAFFEPPRSIS
jgi:hypothetical protein